jgi:pheromone shutdown protein TraB
LKALAAVFEINIADSDKKNEIEQVEEEEAYTQKVKGFYKLLAIAVMSLIVPLILDVNDTANWSILGWIFISWVVILSVYSLNMFDFFGEKWKRKLINRKFKKK